MFEVGGICDLQTAKNIARKLFAQYNNSLDGSLEQKGMEKMMMDTYKIMNK